MPLLKNHRLNHPWMFRAVLKKNVKYRGNALTLVVHYPPRPEGDKIAFNIRKKIGSAVLRNKLKRMLRHKFFELKSHFSGPAWVVCQVNNTGSKVVLTQLSIEATNLFKKV